MRSHCMRIILLVVGALLVVGLTAWSQDALTDTVPRDARYAQPLNHAWSAGVLMGYPDGTFRPNDMLTRAELWAGFNRLLDAAYEAKAPYLLGDISPTYARGVRDHWGFASFERLLSVKLIEHRPMPWVRDLDAPVQRLECAQLAVAALRGFGVIAPGMAPSELAIGDIMVRQADGKVHFHELMPRWEFAVAMDNMLRAIVAAGG